MSAMIAVVGLWHLNARAEIVGDSAGIFLSTCLTANQDVAELQTLAEQTGLDAKSPDGLILEWSGENGAAVRFMPAESTNEPFDECNAWGETDNDDIIAEHALSQNLIEIPKEEVAGDLDSPDLVLRTFVNEHCTNAEMSHSGCVIIQFIGDRAPENSTVFRKFNYRTFHSVAH